MDQALQEASSKFSRVSCIFYGIGTVDAAKNTSDVLVAQMLAVSASALSLVSSEPFLDIVRQLPASIISSVMRQIIRDNLSCFDRSSDLRNRELYPIEIVSSSFCAFSLAQHVFHSLLSALELFILWLGKKDAVAPLASARWFTSRCKKVIKSSASKKRRVRALIKSAEKFPVGVSCRKLISVKSLVRRSFQLSSCFVSKSASLISLGILGIPRSDFHSSLWLSKRESTGSLGY